MDRRKIFTKVKDEPPAKYNEEANVHNSIIADGCIIEGTVKTAFFSEAYVMKGVVIKNSLVMQGTTVEQDVQLNYCILDKGVTITEANLLMAMQNGH